MHASSDRPMQRMSRIPRGGVLVFAIVVLSILLMLAASFLMLVRQGRRASSNSLNNVETQLTTEAGLKAALRNIRTAVSAYVIGTPDAPYGTVLTINYDPATNPLAPPHPTRHFEITTADADYPTGEGALLFWDLAQDYNGTAAGYAPGVVPPHFTTSMTATSAWPTGQLRAAPGGPGHDGTARRFEVTGVLADFYAGNNNIQKLPPIGGVRGEYYVWVSDLDSKLYAVTKDWGVDTLNTVFLGSEYDAVARKGVLDVLNTFGDAASVAPASTWDAHASTVYQGMQLDGGDLDHLRDIAAGKSYRNISELALELTGLDPAQAEYTEKRGALEHYFTVNKDVPDVANVPFAFVKEHPAAININTAPVEIIFAALSQIPADDTAETLSTKPPVAADGKSLAWHLAQRIVLKRPFLCRMDFEDFLAAHIKGRTDEPDYLPANADLDGLTPIDDPALPFVSWIHFAIDKRWGPQQSDTNLQTPEMSLSEYLEIPGVPPTSITYSGANLPIHQKERFVFFFQNDAAITRQDANLTVKEFNNLINSITFTSYIDDEQIQPLGPADPFVGEIIRAGPNGSFEVIPLGDDVIGIMCPFTFPMVVGDDDDSNLNWILPGPNGVLDTVPDTANGEYLAIVDGGDGEVQTVLPKGRPSYYSFVDDAQLADSYYANNEPAPTPPALDPATELSMLKKMKFYYRLPTAPGAPDPVWTSAVTSDLISWRCNPDAGTNRRPGFYQMSFDNWTEDIASYCLYGYGPMQSLGNPDNPDDYAAANPSSGTKGNGDVSWSPQFAFRSRFFQVFVLGRGLAQDPQLNVHELGEQRLEAVYDALKDEVLWQRSQLSPKRALGE